MENDENSKLKNIILENIFSKNLYLDLSHFNLKELPQELYEAHHLEYLYLSHNNLQNIPMVIFDVFSKLKLLDLRFNKLTIIPGEIKKLSKLEILLLDGNFLTTLPNEMGLLENLRGLNIGSNPIRYPKENVIKSGYRAILFELNNNYFNRYNGNNFDTTKSEFDSDHECDPSGDIKSHEKLFKPKIYKEIHQTFLDKNRKSSQSKSKHLVTQSSKHENMVKLYPEPVSLENIERKMIEQMRLVKIKEAKQQKEAILQNVKDKNAINDWREEARDMQIYKKREQNNKLPLEIKLESDSRVLDAPFKVEKNYLEIMGVDELNSIKQKSIPKTPKPQPIDRETQLMIEAEKRNRQKTIHLQIKKQGEYLMNKRNNPKGTVQEEVESAKRDLEILSMLRRSLMNSNSDLRPF